MVTSTSAQITNTVSPQQILSLPLVTRNPLTLTQLQAGTAPSAASPFQVTSINGMRTTLTNITRDGINVQDAFIRSNATDFAPVRHGRIHRLNIKPRVRSRLRRRTDTSRNTARYKGFSRSIVRLQPQFGVCREYIFRQQVRAGQAVSKS